MNMNLTNKKIVKLVCRGCYTYEYTKNSRYNYCILRNNIDKCPCSECLVKAVCDHECKKFSNACDEFLNE